MTIVNNDLNVAIMNFIVKTDTLVLLNSVRKEDLIQKKINCRSWYFSP